MPGGNLPSPTQRSGVTSRHISLQFKVIFSFLVIAALLAAASVYQIRSVQGFSRLTIQLLDTETQKLHALQDMQFHSVQTSITVYTYQQQVTQTGKKDDGTQKKRVDQLVKQLQANENRYVQLLSAAEARGGDARQLSKAAQSFIVAAEGVLDDTSPQGGGRSASLDAGLQTAQTALDTAIGKLRVQEEGRIATLDSEVDRNVVRLQTGIVLRAITGIVLALGVGIFIASWIARSLSRIKRGAEHIANGDFSHPIEVRSRDEMGDLGMAFNHMAERLKEAYRRQAIGQQRDEAMMLSMGEGLIAVDGDSKIVFINQVASKLLDIPDAAEVVGRSLYEVYQLYTPDDKSGKPLPIAQRPSALAMHTGAAVNQAYVYHKKDGTSHILNITANPVKLNGQSIGAVTVLRDVTKEKEVDRMKTEFISLASHQLRTPLSAIKWFSEMLANGDAGKLNADQLDFAKSISESTERMIDLVNALLNISRIESGRIMVDPKPTDLQELVDGVVRDLKAKIDERQHSLIVSVHQGLPKINLDPRLIGQVYLNLLTNAIKYTPKGGEISVFISRKGDQIISQVTDNGFGIPASQQDRLFQKFFRAENAVKVETDGTGLGLYLIKAIIESSGGKIWFKSEEGKGTTFWFSMPMSGMKAKAGEVTLDV